MDRGDQLTYGSCCHLLQFTFDDVLQHASQDEVFQVILWLVLRAAMLIFQYLPITLHDLLLSTEGLC